MIVVSKVRVTMLSSTSHMILIVAACTLSLVLFWEVCYGASPKTGTIPATNLDLPALDMSRVDDLGWTDAHHVAFGSPLRDASGSRYVVHPSQRRQVLEDASNDFLCKRNEFGQTPLHLAVRENALDIVELYVDRQLPCLNWGNLDGDTPLHYASAWGRKTAAELLLQGGANPRLGNNKGETPLEDAKTHGFPEIIKLLHNNAVAEGVYHPTRRQPDQEDPGPGCHRYSRLIIRLLGTWVVPTLVLLFVVSFEITRRRGVQRRRQAKHLE